MRLLQLSSFALVLCLSILLHSTPVLGGEQSGRYQLISAQYEDKQGNVHPVVYRIDTMTGNTSRIVYFVTSGFKEGEKVGAFAFEDVYKDEPEFFLHMDKLRR